MKVEASGVVVHITEAGKIRILKVDQRGVAARSGIRNGQIVKAVNRMKVDDLQHLEGLLLQSGGSTVQLELESTGPVLLPTP